MLYIFTVSFILRGHGHFYTGATKISLVFANSGVYAAKGSRKYCFRQKMSLRRLSFHSCMLYVQHVNILRQ